MTVLGVGFPRTAAEDAAGVVPVNHQVPVGHVERYGAVGDGKADDAAAIGRAIAVVKRMGGGRVVFEPATYFVGDASKSRRILDVSDLSNVIFEGNGAELVCNTLDASQPIVLCLRDPERLTINDLRFRDRGADLSIDWRGAWAIWIEVTASPTHPVGDIHISACRATSMVGFLRVADENPPFANRVTGVTLVACRVSDSYYAINCRENGDDLVVVSLRCENVRRAYLSYGVSNHDIALSIHHDGKALGSNGAVVIGRYRRDTWAIRIRAVFEGSGAQYGSYVYLQHGPNPDAGGTIEDVDLDVHASRLSPNNGVVVSMRSYRGAPGTPGAEETKTTTNRWNRIRLAGSFGAGANVATPFAIGVQQEREGVLVLDPSVTETIDQVIPHYPGFVVRVAHDREVRTLRGPLPVQTVVIPLAQLDVCAFALRLVVYAHGDASALAAQNATFSEDMIIGYNAGGGGVRIQTVRNRHVVAQGTAVAVAYVATAENLVVAFSGSTYDTPRAFARVEVQYVGRGPQY